MTERERESDREKEREIERQRVTNRERERTSSSERELVGTVVWFCSEAVRITSDK